MGLSKFIQDIKNAFKSKEPFDSTVFDHPIAQKTGWGPQAPGGASFKTRNLSKVSSSKLIYKGSISMIFFGGVFMVIPLIIFITIFGKINDIGLNDVEYIYLIFPLIFMTVGFFIAYNGYRPIVLDKKLGYLYKSYKKPRVDFNVTPGKKWVPLDQVVALQILKERVKGKNSSYTSYEINFIFKDASRHNVIDHGNLNAIENDAVTISNFLNVPIWNKMTGKTTLPKGVGYKYDTSHYDSKGNYEEEKESNAHYESGGRYDDPNENDRYSSSSQGNDDLDEPYDSLKRRKL